MILRWIFMYLNSSISPEDVMHHYYRARYEFQGREILGSQFDPKNRMLEDEKLMGMECST